MSVKAFENGFYQTDKNLIFCSDLEGGNPYNIDVKINGLTFENGIITGVVDNYVLVYLGDLVDNGKNSIKLLEKMCAIENTKKNNLILIAGNRDINKLRLFDECMICDQNSKFPFVVGDFDSLENFVDRCIDIARYFGANNKYKFKYNDDKLGGRLFGEGVGTWKGDEGKNMDEYVKIKDDLEGRIKFIYEKTMGVAKWSEHLVNEAIGVIEKCLKQEQEQTIQKLLDSKVSSSYQKYVNYVMLIFMNIVMGRKLKDVKNDVEITINEKFKHYVGLYVNYLSKTNVVALIEKGDESFIVSHGGLNMDILSSPYFGFKPDDIILSSSNTISKNILNDLNKKYVEHLNKLSVNSYTTELDNDNNKYINYLVHLTAGKNKYEYANVVNSPVLGDPHQATLKYRKQLGGNDTGMKYWYGNFSQDIKYHNLRDGDTTITYNISGHMPQGPTPSVHLPEGDETKHIRLDVSKAEMDKDSSPKYTYSFFLVNGKGDNEKFITGRFLLRDELFAYKSTEYAYGAEPTTDVNVETRLSTTCEYVKKLLGQNNTNLPLNNNFIVKNIDNKYYVNYKYNLNFVKDNLLFIKTPYKLSDDEKIMLEMKGNNYVGVNYKLDGEYYKLLIFEGDDNNKKLHLMHIMVGFDNAYAFVHNKHWSKYFLRNNCNAVEEQNILDLKKKDENDLNNALVGEIDAVKNFYRTKNEETRKAVEDAKKAKEAAAKAAAAKSGGGSMNYKDKYNKYKNKYLELKRNN